MSLRSPFLNNDHNNSSATPRQSPFRRQNSVSPAPTSPSTVRAGLSTNNSPTKASVDFSSSSQATNGSLSPEKASPFVRRPSQNTNRPASPFARTQSKLSATAPLSLPRNTSSSNQNHVPPDETSSPSKTSGRQYDEEDKENNERSTNRGTTELGNVIIEGSNAGDDTDALDPAETISASPTPTSFRDQLKPVGLRTNQRPAPLSSSTFSKPATSQQPPPSFRLNTGLAATGTAAGGSYAHLPPSLLRSMRESFEVLDPSNTGHLSPSSLLPVLEQLSLPNDAASVTSFFPPGASHTSMQPLNLARYLDLLSGPLANLSRPEELEAAFAAFDRDDSGQIDLEELREAALRTAPEGVGEEDWRLGGAEVDGVLKEFASRRVWSGKRGMGIMGRGNGTNAGSGEVFRYRDFMASVSGGGGQGGQQVAQSEVAADGRL